MARWRERMDQLLYPGYSDRWDDKRFREVLSGYIDGNKVCLDFGAGRGNVAEMNFRDVARRVAGVDVDPVVATNPLLHDGHHIDPSDPLPFEAGIFDVVFSDNVLEHVEDPDRAFAEIVRVLKPGGYFIAKTPNAMHYMPLIARTTPTAFHRWYNKLRGRQHHDTFPTRYRCNSRRTVERLAARNGMDVVNIETWEGRPEYLRLTPPTYLAGWLYEKLVNSTSMFSPFRCVLTFVLRRSR